MVRSRRKISAGFLLTAYLLVILSTLAPLSLLSRHVAHAVTGECTGSCEIDGCSLEARRNHTCCCWQKKLRASRVKVVASTPCSPTDRDHAQRVTCSADSNLLEPGQSTMPVYRCGDRCGKGKLDSFLFPSTPEVVPPEIMTEISGPSWGDLRFHPFNHHLSSMEREPPEPPPRLLS
ncbi:MAG: hypothetical protein Fur0034_04770 [Desulfuromonadia bacterium]